MSDKFINIDGNIVKKKSQKSYDKLYTEFKKNHAEEYCETLGMSLEDIERIGYKKFIDAHDWRKISDISKWRTDAVHIIVCQSCKNEFATYELDLGLCKKCKPFFDLSLFADHCNLSEKESRGSSYGLRAAFVYQGEFRENYRVAPFLKINKKSV